MIRRWAWVWPVAALLAAVVWLVAYRPGIHGETQRLQSQAQAIETQIQELNANSDTQGPTRSIAEWEDLRNEARRRYVRPSPATDLFERLDQTANDAGLTVQSLDVRGGVVRDGATDASLPTQTATLTVEGSFEQLYAMLRTIAEGPPYLYVTQADMSVVSEAGQDPTLALSATVVARVAPETQTAQTLEPGRSTP